MWRLLISHCALFQCVLSAACNVRIALYASTISSVKRADAPRDTSEGKSHGSSGSQRSPSPPPAEVSCDTGGGGWRGGLWRSRGRIGPDWGTMGELSMISANNLPQERTQDGHLCHHYSNKNSHKKKHFKNFFSCVNNLLLMIFQQLFKKMVSLLDFTHQKFLANWWRGSMNGTESFWCLALAFPWKYTWCKSAIFVF